jgi:hypothetical protein
MEIHRFTEDELTRMKAYEKRTGQKITYTFDEKCDIYRRYKREVLEQAVRGITNSLNVRDNIDNDDSFDGPDDCWKKKLLEDNLCAIRKILEERLK